MHGRTFHGHLLCSGKNGEERVLDNTDITDLIYSRLHITANDKVQYCIIGGIRGINIGHWGGGHNSIWRYTYKLLKYPLSISGKSLSSELKDGVIKSIIEC